MPRPARLIPLIIASALFMENMDSTVIATSLPAMAADLGTDPIILKLAFTTYLLSLTIFIPVSGWCADRFGARNVFRAAILVFTVGSVACGFTDSLMGLVAARFVQGVGGAMMVPVGRIILLRTVPKAELVDALAWLTIPALVGPLVGPPIGGFITTYFHWRWIFWMNVPFCIIALTLATRFMPEQEVETVPPLDWLGFLLSGTGLSLFVFGVTLVGRNFGPAYLPGLLLLIGMALLAAYYLYARTAKAPILDLKLLRYETFRAGVLGGSLFRIGVGATPFLLPLMLQLGFGLTPFESGLLTCVTALGAITMKLGAAKLIRRFGFRNLLIINGALSSVVLGMNGLVTAQTPYALFLALLLFGGFLRSLQFTALNAMSYSEVDPADMSKATSFYTVAQQLSLSIGVAVAAFVLETTQRVRGDTSITANDFAIAFFAVGAVGLLSILQYWRLTPAAGSAVSGRTA
ncbi:MDR family MFS transporter [Aestuariivirga sp.]|uniref:MDR family MFS transporter n=1 Tax=Aestuariivirga sp. TaxID=2650926 RepID=UPI0039E45F17